MATFLFACATGEAPLTPDIREHLEIAKRCADMGKVGSALAHAAVVIPDRLLRVKVDCGGVPAADQGIYRNAVNGAFRLWEEALGTTIFEGTETEHPDILIRFRPQVTDGTHAVCGRSEWSKCVLNSDNDPTVVFTADVKVGMLKPNGQALTLAQLRGCIAHELGHVLGLDDSPKVGDVMGRMDFNHPVESIRQDEIRLLVRARAEALEIRHRLNDITVKFKE